MPKVTLKSSIVSWGQAAKNVPIDPGNLYNAYVVHMKKRVDNGTQGRRREIAEIALSNLDLVAEIIYDPDIVAKIEYSRQRYLETSGQNNKPKVSVSRALDKEQIDIDAAKLFLEEHGYKVVKVLPSASAV